MEKYIKKLSLLLLLSTLIGCDKKDYSELKDGDKIIYNVDDLSVSFSKNVNDKNDDCINIVYSDNESNPGYKIYDSYEISDLRLMNDIIDVIYDYNNNHIDSTWDRKRVSLIFEWIIHNELYNKKMYIDHTKDVDFNKNEVEKLKKLF